MPADETHHPMQCMEIWGGSESAHNSISLGGLDAWIEARPHEDAAAGGDVHYLSSCATSRITRLFLADVSGHGTAVAEIASTLRTLMREHVNHLDQRRFVTRMNKAFTEQSTSGIFATAVVCTYFSPTRELSVCNAGHPPPLLYRARERQWQLLEEPSEATTDEDSPAGGQGVNNLPLGILDMASYEQFRVRLEPGDRVLCYTDSLIEARDATGELLGPKGLLDCVRKLPASTSADHLIPALYTSLSACAGASLHNDDLTMLLFTPNATRRHAGFLTRAYAPIRVLGRAIAWRRDGRLRIPLPDLSIANIGGAIFGPLARVRRRL